MGSEGQGLSKAQIAICDEFVYVPQYSTATASLNVSIATAIVLHHFAEWASRTTGAPKWTATSQLAPVQGETPGLGKFEVASRAGPQDAAANSRHASRAAAIRERRAVSRRGDADEAEGGGGDFALHQLFSDE
eukprot:Selendium_serpulae@DN4471_c0_g1_i1.p2